MPAGNVGDLARVRLNIAVSYERERSGFTRMMARRAVAKTIGAISCENVTRLGICCEFGFRSANDTATNEENNIVTARNPARICLIEEKFISGRRYNNQQRAHGLERPTCPQACCE